MLIFLAVASVYNFCGNPPTQNSHALPANLNPTDCTVATRQFLRPLCITHMEVNNHTATVNS